MNNLAEMGMSIHYRGSLKNADLIRPLTNEVADICDVLIWNYRVTADDTVEGISVTPENCETLTLTFLPDGKLASRVFILYGMSDDAYIFTKTQFAGVDTHVAIIRLLRYLSSKYFESFELIDEGGFWETDDVAVLRAQFKQYEATLDAVTDALKDFRTVQGETVLDLAKRLEDFLQQRLDNKEP